MAYLFPFAVFQAITAVWILAQLGIARVLRLRAILVSLGMGPRVTRFKLGELELELGLFPTGGYVSIDGMAEVPAAKSTVLAIGPWLLVAIIALALGARAIDFLAGATVLLRANEVFAHWARWLPHFVEEPQLATAQLAARIVAINMLPLPGLAGWKALGAVVPARWLERAATPVVVVAVVLAIVSGLVRGTAS